MTTYAPAPTRGIRAWIRSLDQLLRGQVTELAAVRGGQLKIPVGGVALVALALAAGYGFCMGWFALFDRPSGAEWAQVLAGTVKFPLLFLLTLVVTLPSLYVFNALVGSRLAPGALVRLLVASTAVMLAVVASFGPIVAFFSVTTTSYSFIVLLNVAVCTVGGLLGLTFLVRTLHRLSVAITMPPALAPEARAATAPPPTEGPVTDGPTTPSSAGNPNIAGTFALQPIESPGALDRLEGRPPEPKVRVVFCCWMVLFSVVGAQMSWVLRPLIGRPDVPFELFRTRGSDFFTGVWHLVQSLLR